MPESDGRLTSAEKDSIIAKIDSLWTGSHSCPVCGHTNWIIGDHLVQPITLAQGSLQLGGPGYPQVMLISSKCGYTMFFNAVVLGVVPSNKSEGSPLPFGGGNPNVKP
jgi:hypothetical protein